MGGGGHPGAAPEGSSRGPPSAPPSPKSSLLRTPPRAARPPPRANVQGLPPRCMRVSPPVRFHPTAPMSRALPSGTEQFMLEGRESVTVDFSSKTNSKRQVAPKAGRHRCWCHNHWPPCAHQQPAHACRNLSHSTASTAKQPGKLRQGLRPTWRTTPCSRRSGWNERRVCQ